MGACHTGFLNQTTSGKIEHGETVPLNLLGAEYSTRFVRKECTYSIWIGCCPKTKILVSLQLAMPQKECRC
jgi:hypothetical protein